MVLSSLLGVDKTLFDAFFPVYTLENLILFPETALMPLRKDEQFIWINYFMNMYSILFSCWVHRFILLFGRPNCDLRSVFYTMFGYFFFVEMSSVVWALSVMTPAYWGVLVVLFLMPAVIFVGGFLYVFLAEKFGFNFYFGIEIRERNFVKKTDSRFE